MLCGTSDNALIWCSHDTTGIIFSFFVWLVFIFMTSVMIDIITNNYIDATNATIILFLLFMAMWSHLKTMFTDPGVVPCNAHPPLSNADKSPEICGRCDGYKPLKSHHGEKCFDMLPFC